MFAFALLLVALAAHAFLVLWARTLFASSNAKRLVSLALGAAGVVWSLSLFADRSHFGTTSFELAIVALGAGLFAALALLVLGARRLRKRGAPPLPAEEEPAIGRRDAVLAVAGAAAWGTSGLVLGWGEVRGRHDVELTEHAVRIPGLPKALDGYCLVQISDLHIGEWTTEQDLAAGLELVKLARPDLLVVTGDIVDFDASYAAGVASQIMRVAPRDGVLGILGNHDYYAGAETVRAALESAGIGMLVNQSRAVRERDGGGFVVCGLDDLSASKHGGRGPDLEGVLARAGAAPRILLAHQPPQFDAAAGRVALQLSGHTHGYQFGFAAGVGRVAHRYVSGPYEKAGSHLWVNRGFGVTGPPSRVGVRPEVSKIVLIAG